jgi:hypothetical protein
MDWLGSDDPAEIRAAVRLLMLAGPAINEFLLMEAAKSTIPVLHVFRLLDLVGRIGGRRGPVENHYLRKLRQHWSLLIQEKAKEVKAALSPMKSRSTGYVNLARAAARVQKVRLNMAMGRGRWGRGASGRKPFGYASPLPLP